MKGKLGLTPHVGEEGTLHVHCLPLMHGQGFVGVSPHLQEEPRKREECQTWETRMGCG